MPKKLLLYTNCWEDADVLLAALDPGPDDRVLSIGSAGDNSFSLLSRGPASVVVYDAWLPQLHLVELKKAAFQVLDYEEFLAFLGFQESRHRMAIFHEKIRPALSPEAQVFWENNMALLQRGVIHCGKLEHYFRLFRRYVLPIIATKKDVDYFFTGEKTESDLVEYRRRLNNPFLHVILKFFLSEPVLKATGRQPAFFNEVKLSLSKYLFEKLSAFILNPESHHNYYMYYAAHGHFGKGLPHYARPENFEAIRSKLDRLTLRHGRLEDGLVAEQNATLVNASDIFEYMPMADFKAFGERLAAHCPILRRIAYWNFVVDRMLSEVLPDQFHLESDLTAKLSERDKIYFYMRFLVEGLK
jgi:S-adenosylmethionine-diacylglycerol 3-amino-3-carboxypropyl transferase